MLNFFRGKKLHIYILASQKKLVKIFCIKQMSPLQFIFLNNHIASVLQQEIEYFTIFYMWLSSNCLLPQKDSLPLCSQPQSKVPRIVCVQAMCVKNSHTARGGDGELLMLIASSVPSNLGAVCSFKRARFSNKPLLDIKTNYIKSNKIK